jgi:hypothetical protein
MAPVSIHFVFTLSEQIMERGEHPCENPDTTGAENIVDNGTTYPARLYHLIQQAKRGDIPFDQLRTEFLSWAKPIADREERPDLFDPSSAA